MPEVKQNTAMAAFSYILFFVPLISGVAKKDEFVKFHAKQGLVLFLVCVAFMIVSNLVPYNIYWSISWIFSLVNLAIFVIMIIGIANALKGKKEPLPIIGKLADNFKF